MIQRALNGLTPKLENINGKLMMLSISGSRLHGTHRPESDYDFKGVYVPSYERMLLGFKPEPISYKDEVVDVTLWPLQIFLQLCRHGETNAVDLYFSERAKEKWTGEVAQFFNHLPPDKLINRIEAKAFTGFAINMARKYGVRGERYQALKRVANLPKFKNIDNARLINFMAEIIDIAGNKDYCYEIESNGERALSLCGKIHHGSINLSEFFERVERHLANYGDRVKDNIEKPDWKALSHSLRVLDEYQELLLKGTITFPLESRRSLKSVKMGNIPFETVSEWIEEKITQVDSYLSKMENDYWSYDEKSVVEFLKVVYS